MQLRKERPLDDLSGGQTLHKGSYVLRRQGATPDSPPGGSRLEGHWEVFPAERVLGWHVPAPGKERAEEDARSPQKVAFLPTWATVPLARVFGKR